MVVPVTVWPQASTTALAHWSLAGTVVKVTLTGVELPLPPVQFVVTTAVYVVPPVRPVMVAGEPLTVCGGRAGPLAGVTTTL